MEPIPNSRKALPSCVSRSAARCCSWLSPGGGGTANRESRSVYTSTMRPFFSRYSHSTHVLWCRVAFHEAAPAPTGSIDHPHQIAHRPPSFQPVVFRGVPLHQLAEPAPPGSPPMHFHRPLRLARPHSGLAHPTAQRLFAHLDLMTLGPLFGGKRRPEVMPVRLLQDGQCLSLCFC